MTEILVTTLPDPERIKFALVRFVSTGKVKRRGISLRVHKRLFRMITAARDRPEFEIIVASLTVSAGELSQRQTIKRVLTPGVRGISISPKKSREFLLTIISPKTKGEEKGRMLEDLETMISQALQEFKARIGLPEESPQAYCFTISEEVIEAAVSEKCREYLGINAQSCPHILSGDMPHFLEILGFQFPEDVDAVKQVLEASRTRDHLAAISITGDGDDLNVTLVNSAGARITMKAWRFLQVITHPNEPIQLGEFPDSRRYQEPEIIYNNHRRGVVHGRFSDQHASIEVICIDPDKSGANALLDRSNIAIDLDYALCVALVLNRLQNDRERVSHLVQELLTNAVDDGHRQLFTLS